MKQESIDKLIDLAEEFRLHLSKNKKDATPEQAKIIQYVIVQIDLLRDEYYLNQSYETNPSKGNNHND